MEIIINYMAPKTVKVKVDDIYKTMVNDDKAWENLITPFAETVLKKIQEIENNCYLENDDILGVSDAETDEVIFEN